jgi:predicted DNA-binding transcriptional regulator YafY
LRFGADIEVIAPKSLRTKVQKTLLDSVGRYVS